MGDFVILITTIGGLIIIAALICLLIANFNIDFAIILFEHERLFYVLVTIGLLLFVTGPIIMLIEILL